MGSFKQRISVLAMVAIMSVFLAACGDSGGASNADLLKKAGPNMKALKSYRIDVTASQDSMNVTMGGDVDVANKKVAATMGVAGMNINSVSVDGANYTSMDGGKTFTKDSTSNNGLESFTKMWDSFKPEDVDKAKDSLKDGAPATEKIDGVDTKHMTVNLKDLSGLSPSTNSSTPVSSTEGTADLWISTDATPLVRQMKITGKSEGKNVVATVKWSKINQAFDIKMPTNLSTGGSLGDSTPTAGTMMSDSTPTAGTMMSDSTPTAASSNGNGGGSSSNAEMFKSAALNMKALKSYRLEADISSGGQDITMMGDIDVANNKMSMKMSAAGQKVDMVVTDKGTYVSSDGGKSYMKSASGSANGLDSFTKMWDNFKASDIDKAASALKDGSPATEKIDGVETKHIVADAAALSSLGTSGSSSSMTGSYDIWISNDSTPTIRQMKIDGTSAGQKLAATLKWSKINEPLTIAEPSNVIDPASAMTPMTGDTTPAMDMTSEATPGMEMGATAAATPVSGTGGTGAGAGTLDVADLSNVKSYHLALTSESTTSGTTTTSKVEGDFIRPDKGNMVIESSGTKINYVVIGEDAYVSMDGKTYTKTTGGQAIVSAYDSILSSTFSSLKGFNGYQNKGSEAIGGEDCDHYAYDGAASGVQGKYEVWVAKSDKTTRQVKAYSKTGGTESNVIYTITKVNQVGDITAP